MKPADYVAIGLGIFIFAPVAWAVWKDHKAQKRRETYDPTRSIYDDLD